MSLPSFNEKTTGFVNLAFTDEDGDAVAPDSATYTLYDEVSGDIINSRDDTAVPGLASSVDLELEPDDNAIIDSNTVRETHVLLVKWVYDTDKEGKDNYRFVVENLTKVP